MDTTRNGFIFAEDEAMVRTYRCSQMKFPKCTGYLTVTNRRVIFHGYGGSDYSGGSRIVNEVPLDAVSGINTFYGGRLLIGRIIAGILLFFVGIGVMGIKNPFDNQSIGILIFLGIIIMLIAIVLMATCYRKTFFLKIYSSKGSASPIQVGEGAGGIGNNSALLSVTAMPTDETDKMMLELGAMISDIQSMGDLGIQKWGNIDKKQNKKQSKKQSDDDDEEDNSSSGIYGKFYNQE